jgi:DNA polymerase elongation subunit (family B)
MTTIIKKTLEIKSRSFKLVDFHIFDEVPTDDSSSSSDDDEEDSQGLKKYKKRVDKKTFTIQIFGVNEKGETVCLFINDYSPFFFIKVPEFWTQRHATEFTRDIKKRVGDYYENSILDFELSKYHKLYGFSGGKKENFIKLVFKNMACMNKVKSMFYETTPDGDRKLKAFIYPTNNGQRLQIYEGNIPPLLRYFHIHNISPSGWVKIQLDRVINQRAKTTTCNYEYICEKSAIIPLNEKERRVPYKICSFDIEASSSHGDFPVPKKDYKRLAGNIVDVFTNRSDEDKKEMSFCNMLLKKSIKTAFGYSKIIGIDLVYPKTKPSENKPLITEEFIDRQIEKCLSITIEHARKVIEENNQKSIKTVFEEIKNNEDDAVEIDDVEVEESFACDEPDEDSDAEDGDGGEDTPAPTTRFYSKKTKPKIKINKNTKIIDVLLNETYSREEKIQELNTVLNAWFPPLEGDKTTFIGSTFIRYGEQEPYLNHCLVVGSCDNVEGAEIETTETEADMLVAWKDLIQKENPDIIIGYNIFGFDYEFLFRRAEELGVEREFLKLSRNKEELCAKEDKLGRLSIENSTTVLASGPYELKYPKIVGRIQIDVYNYFRREFNLGSYKLDNVAGQFICDDIKKIECKIGDDGTKTTMLYSKNLIGLHKNDFIHIELSSFTTDYYADGKKFRVLEIMKDYEVEEQVKDQIVKTVYNVIVIEGHHNIQGYKSIKWGMAKDDVSPQDIFRLANGSSADRAVVAKYCICDCNLVHHLMNKIDVLTGYIEMSNICSVPISFLVFRGQGIKLTSFVAKKCREKETLMPDLDKATNDTGYEGAIVLPPKCSMYMDNPVACVDYSSLYPSSMISQNLSHDSKVWRKEYDLEGNLVKEVGDKRYDNLPGYHYIDLEFDNFEYKRKTLTSKAEKVKCGKTICRWAQFPENRKGIMPSILEELLKARSDTRKMIKTEKDPFMQNILDKRQLGYKVTANSLYGQCGSRTSTFYEKDVAASTTATGRMMIIYARRIIEEVYQNYEYKTEKFGPVLTRAEYVYGDSVANYTPVYVRVNNKVVICTIEELACNYGNNNWIQCKEEGKQEKEFCELENVETWSDKGWTKLYRVIRHQLASHKKMMRIITSTGLVDVTDDHSLLLNDGSMISPKDCSIGTKLLHHPLPNINSDILDMVNFLFDKIRTEKILGKNKLEIDFATQKNASKFYILLTNIGLRVLILDLLKGMLYRLVILFDSDSVDTDDRIKKMEEIPYTGYVYDLTTENHHFAAGIGNMIVHNTDSVFFTFNLQNPETKEKIVGKDALEITIEIAQDAAKLCTQWLKPPMELSYEKTLMPFILLSKKRYVGMLYETDPNKGKLKYMGLAIKRRDSCDYLKDIYGGILNILMKEQDIQKSIEFLNKSLNTLIEGGVPMEKLAITRALNSNYANPKQIAHKVLADRIAERDPGNKPKSGDRIKYLYFVNNTPKALQGEKIETPEFIIDNKLKIDYAFYITNQLMKPLQQLFGLALEQIWEKQNKTTTIKTYRSEMANLKKDCGGDLEVYSKKKEKICSQKVKAILFDSFLIKIANEKNKNREITSMFMRK